MQLVVQKVKNSMVIKSNPVENKVANQPYELRITLFNVLKQCLYCIVWSEQKFKESVKGSAKAKQ